MSVVVIGAGQAGCQAAVSLREQGYRGPVTIVGDENVPPYQRPPLTKAYLAGDVDLDGVLVRPESFYAAHGIDLVLGDPAVAVARENREVVLRSGLALRYSHLVLATGARPRTLPGALPLRTVADAEVLRERLHRPARALVIGAGFVGLEFAAVARTKGHEVTVVEALPRALARSVSPIVADHVVARHEERGVRVLLGAELSAPERGNADLVVAGIGVVPNVALAEDAGLTVDDGVVVDAHLRTDDPFIYAIGDCASFSSAFAGARIRLESVQNAMDQAACVAAGIMGSAEPYTAVPWFWSDQYDMKLQIAGITRGHDRTEVDGDPSSGRFAVYCYRGDRLLGVECVNKPAAFVQTRRRLAERQEFSVA
jgi:3-phenylpropionate/trans-cinnamate dioxygenase ferredoxin reductase subunit